MPWLSRFNVKVLILWVRTGNLWVRFGLMKCLKKLVFAMLNIYKHALLQKLWLPERPKEALPSTRRPKCSEKNCMYQY